MSGAPEVSIDHSAAGLPDSQGVENKIQAETPGNDHVDGDKGLLPTGEGNGMEKTEGRVEGLGLEGIPKSPKATILASPMNPATLILQPDELRSHPADGLHAPDSPTTSLISSLRDQLRLLSDQSQQLNTKLVDSISRHADLLDQHEALQSNHADLSVRAEGLAKDKRHWEESMNTGLLVERDAITGEMQRLAAGLVEEERRRGSAEERRRKVEDEVDELAATLFDQANTMVASERHGRIEAEERLKSTEDNLAAAEAAMRDMQLHLQSMPTTTSPAHPSTISAPKRKYLASHLPYTEYMAFLTHIRSLRPLKETSKNTFPPPLVSALLTQPHLARTVIEDHDPTLRLDIAPDLSWLSRRGISSAIISGDLLIEPVSANTVISQSTSATHDIGCALCGKPVFPASAVPSSPLVSHFGPPPIHPLQQRNSASRFSLKPFFNATSPSSAPSPTQSPAASPGPAAQLPSVYIFRVARPATSTAADKEKEKEAKSYPLCRAGWCLERLRATCELWHFIRTGIIHVVWHGDDGFVLQAEVAAAAHTLATVSEAPSRASITESTKSEVSASGDAPVPPELPRRKSGWGLGFRLGDKSTTSPAGAGGGGWTKAFSRGASNSPPVSPRLPPPGEEKEAEREWVDKAAVDGEDKLGAPLELEGEKENGAEVPLISESKEAEKDKAAEGDGADIKRTASSGTVDSVDEPATFSTPHAEETTLPEVTEETSAKAKAVEPPADPKPSSDIKLNSPKVEGPSVPASPSRPLPPPIPRRAAARNRTSIVVDGPSQQPTPTASGAVTPVEAESGATKVLAETDTGASKGDLAVDPASELGMTSIDLPPLPARHPRTPTMATQIQTDRVEGEKVYLKVDDDSWEARTWRQVVKLKEDMMRTRLGVSDGDAEA